MTTTTQLAQTPLYDWHVAHGGRMVDFAGWSMPVQYTSIIEEHQTTRTSVGLFDISHMGRLAIGGPDPIGFLDALLTRRVADMKPGQIRYALLCNETGGILDDVLVYRLANADDQPRYMLVVNACNREKIVSWLRNHSQDESRVQDTTSQDAMLAVQGPKAIELINDLFECDLQALRYFSGMSTKINGSACYVSRTGYTGEDGCEILCQADHAMKIWEKLVTVAETIGGSAAGLAARDTLRLEAGMPLYGHELTERINPVQAGLGFALNLRDRTFVGRDAIARFQQNSHQPVRVGLQLEGRRVPREGCQVLWSEKAVGSVTSGTFSPTFQQPIAMAYVKDTAAAPGTSLDVDIRGKKHPATVVPLPFYQRGTVDP